MTSEHETARAFYDTLMRTQWLSSYDIEAHQCRQLAHLLHHAARTTPFYKDRLSAVLHADDTIDWDRWHELPIVRRTDVRERQAEMISTEIPKHHGRLCSVSTSGTSGVPITVKQTRLMIMAGNVARWRLHAWHQLDWTKSMAMALGQAPGKSVWPRGRIFRPWGPNWVSAELGLRHIIEIITPVDKLVEWLARTRASYFTAMPVTVAAVAEEAARQGTNLPLEAAIGFGMQTRPEYRRIVYERLGIPIIEIYGSEECGPIAFQCTKGVLHINSELVKIDIVDEENRPCAPGTQGRVLVTVLHNAAQPLIRYEQGDLASFGEQCDCGLQLPTLGPISGRLKHLFRFAGRSTFMPSGHVSTEIVQTHLQASWYQLAQVGPKHVEVRFVSSANLSCEEIERSRLAFLASLGGGDLDIAHRRLDRNPLKPGQKYIEAVNEFAPPEN